MANMDVFAQQTGVGTAAVGSLPGWRADRTGIGFTATWKQSLILEGKCFHAPFGAMGATDVVALTLGSDLDQPDFGVSMPNGYALIPLRFVMAVQHDADTAVDDQYLIIMADTGKAYDASGTVVSVTPVNMVTGLAETSIATAFEDGSGNITAPTGTLVCLDVAQQMIGVAQGAGNLKLDYQPEVPPILCGPCAAYGWGGGVVPGSWAGFAEWAEVPESRFV